MKKKGAGGRPRHHIDTKQFESLCAIWCTLEEISGVLGVSIDTIERHCKRNYKARYADVLKRFSSSGNVSLRRMQYKSAMEGSIPMQIWLGKQHLGQRETNESPFGDGKEIPQATFVVKRVE